MNFRSPFSKRASPFRAGTIAALADDDADEVPWRWRANLSLREADPAAENAPHRRALLSRLKEVHRRAETRYPSAHLWRDPTLLMQHSQSQPWKFAQAVPLPLGLQRFPHACSHYDKRRVIVVTMQTFLAARCRSAFTSCSPTRLSATALSPTHPSLLSCFACTDSFARYVELHRLNVFVGRRRA